MSNKVVVTGIGVLTPIGNNLAEFSEGLRSGRDGIAPVTHFDASKHRCQSAGELKNIDFSAHFSPEELPYLSRGAQMIRVAAAQGLAASGLDLDAEDRSRIGVVLGTNLGGMPARKEGYAALHYPYRRGRAGLKEPWRALVLDSFICAMSDHVASQYQLGGLSLVMSTACSAGLHALGVAMDVIRSGRSEVMLAGGVDPLSEMPQAGFGVLRSLASDKLRPFSKDRDGTLLGESASLWVLESEAHAKRRGANILAELAGYGGSTDAYHMTRPDETGRGPARAMQAALASAGMKPEQIGYIKAHGTGTPANDVIETRAIKHVFGEQTRVPVSSIKAMVGHSLGSSGAMEAAAAVVALNDGFLPPTLHLDTPDPECDLDYVPHHSRPTKLEAVLSNAFGFGGNNAAMVFRRWEG
ncbi:beta-ketoacyl-[acyl-carrier-protein] synthase family protein [Myxococcus virescens]|uniref:3-oxoacyl-[acyl-carrier-protein] synthase II n=1 Tax=Myxococcus virescens TaxID=83456 RepID=A0A511H9H0_9BACT|nr:beta-ketoacyl-[acyl-carrier-protein] synthase family protein [Myxococcus virescens]GEL70181.1 beta-ketoacyl-[acyl-carrier-protein] synthase II [Myxococcus virescens]SDD78408.1 3-oxoacyl-[acyl-carrier-protein] synthase II [Myxococcus virescens]